MSDAMYYIARKRCAERSRKMKKLPLAVLLLTLYAGISGCNDRPDRQSLQNIEAFARMYGLV